MFQQLSNLSLSQYIQDQNITEDRAIKTKHLSTIKNVLELLDQACDQSFDFLTKLFQNNNIDFENKIIMVEVRGAYLIGKILKLAFEHSGLNNLFIDIQGKKIDDGSLSEYIRSFIINQNKLKDFDQLLQYNPLILTEVVNTGTTISLSAMSQTTRIQVN